jgi:hypothetical protein
MARYDSPGFAEQVPGIRYSREAGMTSPGTAAPQPQELTGETVQITPVYGGNFTFSVDSADVLVPAQEALYRDPGVESISGVDGIGRTGAGEGHVNHFVHPNGGA